MLFCGFFFFCVVCLWFVCSITEENPCQIDSENVKSEKNDKNNKEESKEIETENTIQTKETNNEKNKNNNKDEEILSLDEEIELLRLVSYVCMTPIAMADKDVLKQRVNGYQFRTLFFFFLSFFVVLFLHNKTEWNHKKCKKLWKKKLIEI